MRVIFLTLMALLLVIFISGLFLYYKGPKYALEKAKVIAKKDFQTEIAYENIGLIGKHGFFIDNLQIKKEKINLAIKNFRVKARIDLNPLHVQIDEVLVEQPTVLAELRLDNKDQNETEAESVEPTALEQLITDPPSQVTFRRLHIKDLKALIQLSDTTEKGEPQQTVVSTEGLDLELNMDLKAGQLAQEFNLSVQKLAAARMEPTKSKNKQSIDLGPLESQIRVTINKEPGTHWRYDLNSMVTQVKIKQGTFDKDFSAKIGESQLRWSSQARLTSDRFLNFTPLHLEQLQWELVIDLKKLQATGKPAFGFLDKKGADLNLETQGTLKPATAQSNRFDLPWTWDAKFKIKAGPFSVERVRTNLMASGHWRDNKGRVAVETRPKTFFKLGGTTELQKKQLQFDGQIEANIPMAVAENLTQKKFSGGIRMPLHLLVLPTTQPERLEVNLDTVVAFERFDFENSKIKMVGLSGQIPISEKVSVDTTASGLDAFKFKHQSLQNPFERVDYERLDPLVRSSDPMRIEQIVWDGRSIGPIEGVVDIEQNLVSVHSFSMDFAQGSASGELFVDLYSRNQRIGFLGRLTQLDLVHILPQRFLGRIPRNSPLPFSSRAGLVFSLNRRSLEGRMDVTQVGGPQLVALINVLDPNYENEKMNKLRSLLQVGYPTSVNMALHEGSMDLSVDIEAMGLKSSQRLPGISIQSFIDKALEEKMTDRKPGNPNLGYPAKDSPAQVNQTQ
jgi:hypothetical protein